MYTKNFTINKENAGSGEIFFFCITKDSKCKSELFLKELVASNKRSAA